MSVTSAPAGVVPTTSAEFVNVPLDIAYAKGELDKIVEKEGWKPVIDDKTNEIKYTAV